MTEQVDADFEQEMAAHLAAAEEDGRRRGLTGQEARRAALVQLGGLAQLREASRAAQGLPWLGSCWLRFDNPDIAREEYVAAQLRWDPAPTIDGEGAGRANDAARRAATRGGRSADASAPSAHILVARETSKGAADVSCR